MIIAASASRPRPADRGLRARHLEAALDPVAPRRHRELDEEAFRGFPRDVLSVEEDLPVGRERLLRGREARGLIRFGLHGEALGTQLERAHRARPLETEPGPRARSLEDGEVRPRVHARVGGVPHIARRPRNRSLRVKRRGVARLDLGADRGRYARRRREVAHAREIQGSRRGIERDGIEDQIRAVGAEGVRIGAGEELTISRVQQEVAARVLEADGLGDVGKQRPARRREA